MSVSKGTRYDINNTLQNSRNVNKPFRVDKMSTKPALKGSTVPKNAGMNERTVTVSKLHTSEFPQKAPKTSKCKTIPIRHTLTSKLRMEKANPLLTAKPGNCNNEQSPSQVTETPIRRSTFQPGMLQIKQKLDFKFTRPVSENRPTFKKNVIGKERQSISSRLFKEKNCKPFGLSQNAKLQSIQSSTEVSKMSQTRSNNHTNVQKKINYLTSQSTNNSQRTTQQLSKPIPPSKNLRETRNPVVKNSVLVSSTIQSSLLKTKESSSRKTAPKNPQLKSILRRSVSVGDVRKGNAKGEQPKVLGGIENRPSTTKTLNKSIKSVAFYSPLLNTTFSSPSTINTPPPSVLRKRLEDWLMKRGKTANSYRHLCCFGLPKLDVVSQSQPESRLDETITLESSDSTVILSQSPVHGNGTNFENSVPNGSSTPEEESAYCVDDKENTNIACLAHPEALKDLRKLVYSGYPRDQCELWLSTISKSHPAVKDLPQYWECLAAVEETRGDFGSAVDCYGKAIVKGADAEIVDEQLDELWEKFSALNMKGAQNKRTPTKKQTLDTKQIFKSTVIKFALQQKAVKKFSKETGVSIPSLSYIVTPVRRSSRKSYSQFRSTPTVTCVDTLDDLDKNVREAMEFHGNAVLNPGN